MSPRVLLVDDEANIRKMVAALLESEGFETAEAANGSAAVAEVERDAPDAVLLDLMMPGGPDGLATIEQLKRVAPDLPVVMMSGKANLADAVRATKLGAFQFLEKPLTPEGLLTTLRAALELSRTLAENRRLHEALGHADPLVGVSNVMEQLRALIARVAPTEARVLITGESGTGKELVASATLPRAADSARAISVRSNPSRASANATSLHPSLGAVARGAPSPGTTRATSSAVTTSPPARIARRSMMFASSRTFPGQG